MELCCGIDEAGRGCLAGSLFVAGVVCEKGECIHGVRDSKQLSKSQRFALEPIICARFHTHIVKKHAWEIDAFGLSAMLKDALEEIMRHFCGMCSDFIFDGNTSFKASPPDGARLTTLIKGDMKLCSIAAASIIAKCAKDRESLELDKLYPAYQLHSNAGYGTKAHYEALNKYGASPIHRASFLTKA